MFHNYNYVTLDLSKNVDNNFISSHYSRPLRAKSAYLSERKPKNEYSISRCSWRKGFSTEHVKKYEKEELRGWEVMLESN
jgi:hypothetical protein